MTICMHFQLRTLFLLSPALGVYEAAALAECLRRGWMLTWVRALFSVLGSLPRLIRYRHRYQQLRQVRDRDLLNGGPLPFATGFVSGSFLQGWVDFLNWSLNSYWGRVRKWL
jgi:hypothetical protein